VILDTSVIVALLLAEPDAPAFARLIKEADVVRMSAASYVELAAVIDGRRAAEASGSLDPFLERMRVVIEPLTERQARIARDVNQRYGRGSGHPARLNMGDCFAYALARDLGEPLLFKGNDFAQTDIELVTTPIRTERLSEIVAAYGASAL
jgi:ribonuclease VapC